MTENEQTTQDDPRGPSIGIYPSMHGIVLDVSDGLETKQQVLLSPDDASKIAINLITNIVLFQMNTAMRAASENIEVERMRQLITQGVQGVPSVPSIS